MIWPIKPRSIGLGPHTNNRVIGLRLKFDVQGIYLLRCQFRRALTWISAAKKTMCVGQLPDKGLQRYILKWDSVR